MSRFAENYDREIEAHFTFYDTDGEKIGTLRERATDPDRVAEDYAARTFKGRGEVVIDRNDGWAVWSVEV